MCQAHSSDQWRDAFEPGRCSYCSGTGTRTTTTTCSKCSGTGKVTTSVNCGTCNGTGGKYVNCIHGSSNAHRYCTHYNITNETTHKYCEHGRTSMHDD